MNQETKKKVLIIAEAGVNHNGDIKIAFKLCKAAKEAGVDIVKFQTWKTEKLITKQANQAEYQIKNTGKQQSQYDMVKALELSYQDFVNIKNYCRDINISFLSTPDEEESLKFLVEDLELDIIKIGSGEINNYPFLKKIGAYNKSVIISTGMCNLSDIEQALDILVKNGTSKDKITVLHCNTEYPTPIEHVNLSAINTIREAFKVNVGYSDHTLGINVPVAATVLGATVIEKHFTLDKTMKGPDHKASLDPKELKSMVIAIREIEKAMGSGVKEPSPSERKNINIVRKSIVAKKDIKKGDAFNDQNLTVKRPGNGISPLRWEEIQGKKASQDYKIDDLI